MSDKLVERLRERASNALAEGTATASGDALHFEQAADALEAQQARIVELEAEARRWEAGAEAEAKANWSTRVVSQGMQARIRALEEVLRPFADIADLLDSETEGVADDDEMELLLHDYLADRLTVFLFRRAKQVLEGKK